MRHVLLSVALLLSALALPVPGVLRAQGRADSLPVFRAGVSLVQLDAVVTDRRGRHVTTLGPSDFEVWQDGRRQMITAVVYMRSDEPLFVADDAPPASVPLRPRDARRIIGVVVDDARMSFSSIYQARRALTAFIDRQMMPDDLVSIVTTTGVRGSSWPFTFSRPQLRSAVGRLRFSMMTAEVDPLATLGFSGPLGMLPSIDDEFRERTYAVAALNRVVDVIEALRPLPGRKAIVLLSEGFVLFGSAIDGGFIRDAMRLIVDRANRAAVVVYAVDPRGLMVTSAGAADGSASHHGALAAQRGSALRATQDGLRYVAAETGGFAVVDSNDIPGAFRRVLDDQRGYYLIGYQPETATFSPASTREFRKLKLKVVRPGLKVRARAGFYGIPTE
jgi:VWFA-related protein